MDAMTPSILRVIPALGAIALLIPAALGASAAAPEGEPLLPDLDQEMPTQLVLTKAGKPGRTSWRLGFRSAVRNIGAGPLIIDGRRPSAGERTMDADQVIVNADGPASVVRGTGRLRYVRSPDHQHWHLLRFDRYELRRAGGSTAVVRDRKTGFCLGDRYQTRSRVEEALPPAPPRYRDSDCDKGKPESGRVEEGITPGWGDDYHAHLEGQSIDITRLRAGRYLLVHAVNPDRTLRERSYTNNVSSALIRIGRPRGGGRTVRMLARCPQSARCSR